MPSFSLSQRENKTVRLIPDGDEESSWSSMDQLQLTRDGVTMRETVEKFGETTVEEKKVPYDELSNFEVELSTNGYVSLEDMIEIGIDSEDGIESITIRIDNALQSEAAVRPRSQETGTDEVPPVPRIDVSEIQYMGRKDFYVRMRDKPDLQPATVRRLIYQNKEIIRSDLNHLIADNGYEATSGGTDQCLVVLEHVTEEIERHGGGENQRIVWVGAD